MRMSRRLRMLPLLLILSGTSACETVSTGVAVGGDYCRIARPIAYDGKLDTPGTVRQVELHNSSFVCVCEGDCPRKPE